LYEREKESSKALEHYRLALRISPDYTTAQNDLAWLLATCADEDLRDGAQAVEIAERASRSRRPPVPEILDTLGAAYAESGRFGDAIKTAEQAIALARAAGKEALATSIQQRLRG